MEPKPLKILISGGGTGGHIFPAIAIANALKRRLPGVQILFVGAKGRMEMERVPAAGYAIEGLPVAGFDRKRPWRNVAVLFKLWRSMRKAKRIVRDFAPDVAVGVGGYASGPVLKAAQKAAVPTLLQEQNSYAGVTNKLLAPGARRICVAYDGMSRFFPVEKVVKTGNPVRADILQADCSREDAKRRLGFNPNRPLVLVLGGSLGARTINDALKAAAPAILESGASILWQTGRLYEEECQAAAKAIGSPDLKAEKFITDMSLAYCAADVVVSRAGAGTISELQLVGAPCVLVPSPNVAEDHQRRNAEALVSEGAAEMILDAECADKLAPTVSALLTDAQRRRSLSENIRRMALPGADEAIVDIICDLARPCLHPNPRN